MGISMTIAQVPQGKSQSRQTDVMSGTRDVNQRTVPISDLFIPSFVRQHSRFQDIDMLLIASGLDPFQLVDLDSQTRRHWDDFIRLSTTFPDWAAMLCQARGEWVMRRIGIVIDA
jgi:hypothetical protein